MLNEIIAIYTITDDLLKAIGHEEDSRKVVSDAEIITTAVCAAMFFNELIKSRKIILFLRLLMLLMVVRIGIINGLLVRELRKEKKK